MTKHKFSIIFLAVINLMNLASGVITQLNLFRGSDVTSVIPITVDLSVVQILMVNFMAVTILFSLINVVTTYLVCDAPNSIADIVKNAPAVFMILPIILLFVAAFNMINAPAMIDKVSIIVSAIIYLFLNVLNFGCIITIKEDE